MRTTEEPHALIDYLLAHTGVTYDAHLAALLKIRPPTLSKMRHGALGVTPAFILSVHERLGIPVAKIRKVMNGRKQIAYAEKP
jgi:plasmid maintenance system antidote protein VapI